MTEAEQSAETGVQRAPLNKVWVIKIVIITIFLLAFGLYGLYDAVVAYPKRGEAYAGNRQWQYLLKLQEAQSEQPGIFVAEASVPNPAEEYTKLTDPETILRIQSNAKDPASTITLRSQARLQRLEWLRGLKTIGQMVPERTTMENPRQTLADLDKYWAPRDQQPKGLAFYDIPSQWLIMGVCWAFALWLILLMLRTASRRYTWDPKELRLTTPAGSFAASDLAEIDKRKWDKFIVFLRLKEGHTMGTGEMKFDTYRHAKLEEWILAMEEARFGPQEDGEKDDQESSPAEETTPSASHAEDSDETDETPDETRDA